jgi:pimeloyl-ACP methyl ester carboxylesterase
VPHVDIEGVKIYYESHGQGFPLVLCHGLSGDTQAWVNQLPAFSQRYQVVTWDARGHGRSDSPADPNAYGLTRFAEDLKVLLGHLGLEQVYLLGHSMGGGVAVRFASTYPERVKALVVTDSFTGSGLPTTAGVRAMREKSIDLALTQGMNAVADHALQENANVMGRIRGDSVEERAMRMRYTKIDPNGYAGSVRTILDNGFPDEWSGRIAMPTLVMVGDRDSASIAGSEHTHAKITGSEYIVISEAGHMAYLDQPQAFTDNVLGFLSRVEAQVAA